MHDRAVDFSYTHPDPPLLVGWDALSYLGVSRPTMAYLAQLAGQGSVFTFIFESLPNRSQEGWNGGILDAQLGNRRADEVAYPADRNIVVVVSDGNRSDPNYGAEQIAAYADAWVRQSKRPVGPFYGNRYAVDAAIAGAARSGRPFIAGPHGTGGWLPRTWGADETRDPIIQEPNIPSPISGTDFNTVHHDYTGVPESPATTNYDREDDSVLVTNLETHDTAWIVGQIFSREWPGTDPLDAYGVPVDAQKFRGDPPELPLRYVNGVQWFVLRRAHDIALGDFVPGRDKDKPGDHAGPDAGTGGGGFPPIPVQEIADAVAANLAARLSS